MSGVTDRAIAVIGGGIGGLTAALALAKHGASVTVYEQAPALREVGAGLQITPNGACVLNALGLDDALRDVGVTADAVQPMNALTGRAIAQFDLRGQVPRYRFYHRADLLDVLAAGCRDAGVTLKLNAKITDVSADGGFKCAAEAVNPDLTIGADGLHSVVRPVLNPPEQPFFTGQAAWRCVVPCGDVPPVAQIWMAPGRHVVTYPMRNNVLNIVAVQERAAWAAEGWHHADDPATLRAAFDDVAPPLRDILANVVTVNQWGLFRHPVAARWHNGRVAILGDAAHPTLPFLAQGANMAIEDAYVLARALMDNPRQDDALQAYQVARAPRVIRAIAAANANARNYHLAGVQAAVAHTALRVLGRVAPHAFLSRLSWLYAHDVTRPRYQLAAV